MALRPPEPGAQSWQESTGRRLKGRGTRSLPWPKPIQAYPGTHTHTHSCTETHFLPLSFSLCNFSVSFLFLSFPFSVSYLHFLLLLFLILRFSSLHLFWSLLFLSPHFSLVPPSTALPVCPARLCVHTHTLYFLVLHFTGHFLCSVLLRYTKTYLPLCYNCLKYLVS